MNKAAATKLETARAKLHANIDEVFVTLIRDSGAEPKSRDNNKYNLALTIEGGLLTPVPDEWIESFASNEFKDQGLDWAVKYCKDCCEATAVNPKYQGKASGARARLRNWLKNKVKWAGPAPTMVGRKYERENG